MLDECPAEALEIKENDIYARQLEELDRKKSKVFPESGVGEPTIIALADPEERFNRCIGVAVEGQYPARAKPGQAGIARHITGQRRSVGRRATLRRGAGTVSPTRTTRQVPGTR